MSFQTPGPVFYSRHADDVHVVRDLVTMLRINLPRFRDVRGRDLRRGSARSALVRSIIESFWSQAPRVLVGVRGNHARFFRIARLMCATGALLGALRLLLEGRSRPAEFSEEHAGEMKRQMERYQLGGDIGELFRLAHQALGEICERGDAAALSGPEYLAAEGDWTSYLAGEEVSLDHTIGEIGRTVLRIEESAGSTDVALGRAADAIVEHGRRLMALAESLADLMVR